jgi:hypothetical protein
MKGYTLEQLWEQDRFGTVSFEGELYLLMEEAYADNDHSYGEARTVWRARAIDRHGKEFLVTWEPVEGFEQMEDESDCCAWDEPDNVEER